MFDMRKMKRFIRYQMAFYCKVCFLQIKNKLVLAWIEIHQESLMQDWNLAVDGNPVFNIEPLK